ncbi:MAG: hypothetical protein RLZZ628_868 [Bacteroidota bacterium]|jgi:hypothetical protein
MAFTQFKSLGDVVKMYDLTQENGKFINTKSNVIVPLALQEDITFSIEQDGLFDISEAAICENYIYPVLKSVWKPFHKTFLLWSHTSITADEILTGIPDYLFAKRTKFGTSVVGPPFCIAVEAKKDNFEEGWGQCAAEMVAAQKLNGNTTNPIFGIVTNGDKWEFAMLEADVFTKETGFLTILQLEMLYSVIHNLLNRL